MNAIAALGRRVQAAYRLHDRRNRALRRRNLKLEIEEARRANPAPTESQILTPVDAVADRKEDDRLSANPKRELAEHERSPSSDTASCWGDGHKEFRGCGVHDDETTASRPVQTTHNSQAGGPCLRVAEEQSIREKRYVWFTSEDADDYTYGPVRMVCASDGVKEQCVSLLLTLDFSTKVRRAVRARREYAKHKRASGRQMEVAMRFETALECNIADHQRRLTASRKAEEPDVEKEASLEEELSILEQMLRGAQVDTKCVFRALQSKGDNLRAIQTQAMAYLEDAFVYARLMEPESDETPSPIESKNLQEEYEQCRRRMQRPEPNDRPFTPLDLSRRREYYEPPPLSAEEQAREDLVQAFRRAHERLLDAQNAFDQKEYWRSVDLQERENALRHGEEPEDATIEDFDLRWLKRGQEVTRKLIDAEEDFATAKANALEAGIDMSAGDEVSVSVDGEEYQRSFHENRISTSSVPRVANWLTALSSPISPSYNEHMAETDEWASDEVGISDSISVVAEGVGRRRIDEWRKACDE